MGRPARKKCRAEAKAARAGILQAEKEAERKKSLTTKVMEFVNAHAEQVPKWVALMGMTILVKGAIDASSQLTAKITEAARLGTPFKTINETTINQWLSDVQGRSPLSKAVRGAFGESPSGASGGKGDVG